MHIILLSLQFVQDNHYGGEWIPLLIKPQKHDRKDGLKNIGKIFFFPDIQINWIFHPNQLRFQSKSIEIPIQINWDSNQNHSRFPSKSFEFFIQINWDSHSNQLRFPSKSFEIPIQIIWDSHPNHLRFPSKSFEIPIQINWDSHSNQLRLKDQKREQWWTTNWLQIYSLKVWPEPLRNKWKFNVYNGILSETTLESAFWSNKKMSKANDKNHPIQTTFFPGFLNSKISPCVAAMLLC